MKKIFIFILSFLVACQAKKSGSTGGLTNNQLAMLWYLTPNVELRYTDISSPQTRVMMKANGIDPALLKNINEIPVSQYGDGDSDGFKDKFITPKAVTIYIRQIIAWKSVANGGPEPGQETIANGTRIDTLNEIPGYAVYPYTVFPDGKVDWSTSTINGAFLHDLKNLTKEYDRVGLEIGEGLKYHFDNKILDQNYRILAFSYNDGREWSSQVQKNVFASYSYLWAELLSGDCQEYFSSLQKGEYIPPFVNSAHDPQKKGKCFWAYSSIINKNTMDLNSCPIDSCKSTILYSPLVNYGNQISNFYNSLTFDFPIGNRSTYYKKLPDCTGNDCYRFNGDSTTSVDPDAYSRYLFPIMQIPNDFEEGKKIVFNVVATNAFFYDTVDPNSDTFDIAKEIPFNNGKDVKVHLPAFYISVE